VSTRIPGSKTTALSLAVLGNHTSTALILLANGADPDLRESDQDLPTVLHLACALGLTELADRLLTERYVESHPTELLDVYHLHCPSDVPRLAAGLARRGAEVSEDIVGAFLRASKWQSAWELLTSPMLADHLTTEGASSMLRTVLTLRAGELANHVETAMRMLQHLLNLGADPDLSRLLWRQSILAYCYMLK
jgi:ankyrin repeat protein